MGACVSTLQREHAPKSAISAEQCPDTACIVTDGLQVLHVGKQLLVDLCPSPEEYQRLLHALANDDTSVTKQAVAASQRAKGWCRHEQPFLQVVHVPGPCAAPEDKQVWHHVLAISPCLFKESTTSLPVPAALIHHSVIGHASLAKLGRSEPQPPSRTASFIPAITHQPPSRAASLIPAAAHQDSFSARPSRLLASQLSSVSTVTPGKALAAAKDASDRLARVMGMADNVPNLLTICSIDGKQVLYQNTGSQAYAGSLVGRDIVNTSFIQLLLSDQPEDLMSDLLESVVVNGETWSRVVQVPNSIADQAAANLAPLPKPAPAPAPPQTPPAEHSPFSSAPPSAELFPQSIEPGIYVPTTRAAARKSDTTPAVGTRSVSATRLWKSFTNSKLFQKQQVTPSTPQRVYENLAFDGCVSADNMARQESEPGHLEALRRAVSEGAYLADNGDSFTLSDVGASTVSGGSRDPTDLSKAQTLHQRRRIQRHASWLSQTMTADLPIPGGGSSVRGSQATVEKNTQSVGGIKPRGVLRQKHKSMSNLAMGSSTADKADTLDELFDTCSSGAVDSSGECNTGLAKAGMPQANAGGVNTRHRLVSLLKQSSFSVAPNSTTDSGAHARPPTKSNLAPGRSKSPLCQDSRPRLLSFQEVTSSLDSDPEPELPQDQEDKSATEDGPCWHEVTVARFHDPVLDKEVLLVSQIDVTTQSLMEQKLMNITEAQLYLLENMFPRHILERLAAVDPQAHTALGDAATRYVRDVTKQLTSEATYHECVTIMFTDIVGFTSMSKQVHPEKVMTFLNELFSKFDELCPKHKVSKVETAGDCYIVVAGLLKEDEDGFQAIATAEEQLAARSRNARRVASFAIEMMQLLPKFSLFGDTMNTASRMESTSLPGRIQISEATYELLKDDPGNWECTGGVEVKGKGTMNTYLLSEEVGRRAATLFSNHQSVVSLDNRSSPGNNLPGWTMETGIDLAQMLQTGDHDAGGAQAGGPANLTHGLVRLPSGRAPKVPKAADYNNIISTGDALAPLRLHMAGGSIGNVSPSQSGGRRQPANPLFKVRAGSLRRGSNQSAPRASQASSRQSFQGVNHAACQLSQS